MYATIFYLFSKEGVVQSIKSTQYLISPKVWVRSTTESQIEKEK